MCGLAVLSCMPFCVAHFPLMMSMFQPSSARLNVSVHGSFYTMFGYGFWNAQDLRTFILFFCCTLIFGVGFSGCVPDPRLPQSECSTSTIAHVDGGSHEASHHWGYQVSTLVQVLPK